MDRYVLKLFIAGQTSRSRRAVTNLRRVFEQTEQVYDLSIVDILENPQAAEHEKILAIPTLVKISPPPGRRIIGDLSDARSLERELDLISSQRETPLP